MESSIIRSGYICRLHKIVQSIIPFGFEFQRFSFYGTHSQSAGSLAIYACHLGGNVGPSVSDSCNLPVIVNSGNGRVG